MCTIVEYLNQNSGAVQSIATIVLVIITGLYVILTWRLAAVAQRQLAIQQPSVLAYVATRNGRPHVNVTNAGRATAYQVCIKIQWPNPPQGVDGESEEVESPIYGKLSPDDTIAFKSPHDITAKDHINDDAKYEVFVIVKYRSILGGESIQEGYKLDYADHINRMRISRQAKRS